MTKDGDDDAIDDIIIDDHDDGDNEDDEDEDGYTDDAVAVAERKWSRQLDEEDGYTPELMLCLPEAGQPLPLPQVCAAVLEVPATIGQPPPLPPRRFGGRQPVLDHTGKPCGCGCGKKLEHKAYKPCHKCEDKDPSIASNKIRLPCWGKGKCCTVCSEVTRYDCLITPAFVNGYKKI